MIYNKAVNSRRATVLIVALWIVFLLAGLVIVMGRQVRVDAFYSANYEAVVGCEQIIEGAIDYCKYYLSEDVESETSYEQTPFEAMQVGSGYFWAISPSLSDDDDLDYGLCDEAGKINLNTASYDMLTKLPGMTSELAYAIIDWRDGDDEITTGGVESEYYLLLSHPYICKNSLLESVEEVLLVKGADKEILFGEDYNRNGVLDSNENDGTLSSPDDDTDGNLDEGFYNYVTVYSYEPNTNSQGEDRINVNDRNNLSKVTKILVESLGESRAYEVIAIIQTEMNFANIIDFYYKSTMTFEEFEPIADSFTTVGEDKLQGLVNVNSAPEAVLLCLPGLEQTDVDAILKYRTTETTTEDSCIWVTEAIEKEKAIAIGEYITGRSFQYSADIVAASGDGKAFRRYLVVIDNAEDSPKIVYRQSLTNLRWPLSSDLLDNLRNGIGVE